MASEVIFETSMGEIAISPNTALAFVDDTGHESLTDVTNPIFGLGGCVVLGKDYVAAIEMPWAEMKDTHFGGRNSRFHARKLRSKSRPNSPREIALRNFFEHALCGRMAAVATSNTPIEVNEPPYHIIASLVSKQIRKLCDDLWVSDIVLIMEASSRGDILAERYFSRPDSVEVRMPDGHTRSIRITRCFAGKGICAGLEIADFVAHTAGLWSREAITHGRRPDLPRFEAIFRSGNPARSEFFLATAVKDCPVNSPSTDVPARRSLD